MKLLFDQNLSHKLVSVVQRSFPGSSHVKFHDLHKVEDIKIHTFAKRNGYTIVTQDSDLYDLALIKGIPPKIIWIRAGNSSTQSQKKLMEINILNIQHFISDETKICLELF